MAEPFIGQIMLAGFGFQPKSYALCNGQLVPITQNQALFSLLGATYGGNGATTFALPNLQGCTPVGFGPSADSQWQPTPYQIGEMGGTETVTLSSAQIPSHLHAGQGTSAAGAVQNPTNRVFASNSNPLYAPAGAAEVMLSPTTVASAGGGQAHGNMQPCLAINFCIALAGEYPSRN